MEDESKHLIADIPQKAIIEHNGKVLIVMNSEGHWQLPGGRLHEGERPIEGLKREIKEELGVDVEIAGIFNTFVFKSASGKNHFVVVYRCKLLNKPADIEDLDGEASEFKWISSSDELENFKEGTIFWKEYKDILRRYFHTRV